MDTIVVPNVGDKCKAKYIPAVTGNEGREWTDDYIFTVTSIDTDFYYTGRNRTSERGTVVWGQFTGPDGHTLSYYVSEWEIVPDDAAPGAPKSEEQQEIERLRAAVSLRDEQLERVRNEARSAIDTIGQRLIDESNERGWCEQFDRIIIDVNAELPLWLELPTRSKDYIVSWNEQYIVSVSRSMTVTAANEDEAIRIAQNDDCGADSYDVADAVRNGNFEYIDGSSDDWEAEEE